MIEQLTANTSTETGAQESTSSQAVMPLRRDIEFNLPKERISDWHPAGVHVTHFFNAMSLLFPHGERFFINSVRHFRHKIDDPVLLEQVRGFIGQEAMHGREHDDYNDALSAKGLPAERYTRIVGKWMKYLSLPGTELLQLSGTVAAEHLTAILADQVLKHPDDLKSAEPTFAAIWRWHALEETEHKAVAFDVYKQVSGNGLLAYLNRCSGLLIATTVFFLLTIPFHIGLVRAEGKALSIKGWAKVWWFLWGAPGVMRRVIPAWFGYFRPGFHPWDHDNRSYLSGMNELVEQFEGRSAAAISS